MKNFENDFNSNPINIDASINEQANWVFEHIYRHPYPHNESGVRQSFARLVHGVQHVARTAKYVIFFANLY